MISIRKPVLRRSKAQQLGNRIRSCGCGTVCSTGPSGTIDEEHSKGLVRSSRLHNRNPKPIRKCRNRCRRS
tara:strand:+ start:255 stop:467 length:213 start_codon:yes stop_codon:yes gene_type:complete